MRWLLCCVALLFSTVGMKAQTNLQIYSQTHQEIWISQFKEAMRKDPSSLAHLVASRVNPDHAWTTKKLYDSFYKADKYARAVPGAGSGYSIIIDLYKDAVGHPYENWLSRMKTSFNERPEQIDRFARETYRDLVRADNGVGSSAADLKFRDAVKAEISRSGAFGYIDEPTPSLYERANTNVLNAMLSESIQNFNAEKFKEALSSQEKLKEYLEGNLNDTRHAVAAVARDAIQIGADQRTLLEWVAEKREAAELAAEAARQREAAEEFRSATLVLGTLLGFIDREAGIFVTRAAPALLQAYGGVQNLALKGFSFAATGDILTAGLAIQSAFAADPAAERHKQVMETLQAIIEQLDFVIQKLEVIEGHVVAIHKDLRDLWFESGVSAADARSRLTRLEDAFRDYFDYALQVQEDNTEAHIVGRERDCLDQIEQSDWTGGTPQLMISCLSYTTTDALGRSQQVSWTKSKLDFRLDSSIDMLADMRRRGQRVEYYPAALLHAEHWLRNNGVEVGKTTPVIFNAPMWERGVRNHLLFRYRVPDFKPAAGSGLENSIGQFTEMGQAFKQYTESIATPDTIKGALVLHKTNVDRFMKAIGDVATDYVALKLPKFHENNAPVELLFGWDKVLSPTGSMLFDRAEIADALWLGSLLGVADTVQAREYISGVSYEQHEICTRQPLGRHGEGGDRECTSEVWARGYHICRGSSMDILLGDKPAGYFGHYSGEQCRDDNYLERLGNRASAEAAALTFFEYMAANVRNYLAAVRFKHRSHEVPAPPPPISAWTLLPQERAAEAWEFVSQRIKTDALGLQQHMLLSASRLNTAAAELNLSAVFTEALIDAHFGTCVDDISELQELLGGLRKSRQLGLKISRGLPIDKQFLEEIALAGGEEEELHNLAVAEPILSRHPTSWTNALKTAASMPEGRCVKGLPALEQGLGWLRGWDAVASMQ